LLWSWPAWYLVATAQRADQEARPLRRKKDGD
jgi:hypothetical protein